ncbi:MAG: DUF4785 family protein [Gammaproteobacteria bacterium]|nr:DUF4785 family protein [Gammaproteobacteria bacterium]
MNKLTIISACLLIAGSVSAAPVEWAASQPGDQRIDNLPSSEPAAPPSRHAESEPVQFAWPLSFDRAGPAPDGPATESRSYWVDTDGAALENGVKLPLSAPAAVVRISALHQDSGVLLDAGQLQVDIDGRELRVTQGAGGIRLVTGADLQAQGMPVPADTLAFQLPDEGDPRTLNLRLAGAPAEQPLVVHVFEPKSAWTGSISAPSHNWLAGQSLQLDLALNDGERRIAPDSVQAVLVSPDAAHSWPLEVTDDGFGLVGAAPQALPDAGQGLYEVYAYVQGRRDGTQVRRDLKLALSIATPTARLAGNADASLGEGVSVDVAVEVATAGRYQISGQVWGTDADGELQPLAMAQSAALLDPGQGRIGLKVPAGLVSESGLSAPFEVRRLELLDQGRMTLLERRIGGLKIGQERPQQGPGSTIEY